MGGRRAQGRRGSGRVSVSVGVGRWTSPLSGGKPPPVRDRGVGGGVRGGQGKRPRRGRRGGLTGSETGDSTGRRLGTRDEGS